MDSLSWSASSILIIVTIVLVALRLRRHAHVPLATLAVAAGFSLLGLAVERLAIAVCVETFRYLSFCTGPSMRLNRTSGGAVMAGLGSDAMSILRGTIVGSDSRANEKSVAK